MIYYRTFSVGCDAIQNRLVDIIQRWKGRANCESGGEKCLYTVRRFVLIILVTLKLYLCYFDYTESSRTCRCTLEGADIEVFLSYVVEGTTCRKAQ